MKPMMTTESTVGVKIARAVEGAASQHPGGQDGGEKQADTVLHHHVDDEEDDVVRERPEEARSPVLVAQQTSVVVQPGECAFLVETG